MPFWKRKPKTCTAKVDAALLGVDARCTLEPGHSRQTHVQDDADAYVVWTTLGSGQPHIHYAYVRRIG